MRATRLTPPRALGRTDTDPDHLADWRDHLDDDGWQTVYPDPTATQAIGRADRQRQRSDKTG